MPQRTAPYQLLVADDSSLIRSMFTSLPAWEVRVRHVARTRGELLTALARSVDLDAVICDFHLSGVLGGVQVVQHLRENNLLQPETAAILMAGDNRQSNLIRGLRAKPDAILLKPFKIVTLLAKLKQAVGLRRELAELSTHDQGGAWAALLEKSNERLARGGTVPGQVHRFKAKALSALGQTEDLADLYESLLAARPKLVWVQEEWARHDYNMGYVTEAADRLAAIVAQNPAHVEAHKFLAEIQHDFGNLKGMQVHLEDAAQHASHEIGLHRELGHVALFNGDLIVASKTYQAALRIGHEAGLRTLADVVNAIRVLLLQDENDQAWRLLSGIRDSASAAVGLVVLQHFVRAALSRGNESPGVTQRRVLEALHLLDEASMVDAMSFKLMAVESCLMAGLPRESHLRSEALLEVVRAKPPHTAIRLWAAQLNSWACQLQDETLPHGFLHYRQKIK